MAADASLFPQTIDLVRNAVLIVRLDEALIRQASFLDDRILTAEREGRWISFTELHELAPPPAQKPQHFIFHAGHVGSTLISRLLDDAGGVLGLREPLALRVLAAARSELDAPHSFLSEVQWTQLLSWHLACWGRGFPSTRTVVVKATSGASPCLSPILDQAADRRAIHLSLRPEAYIATLLSGANSALDLRGQAQERMRRLSRFATAPLAPLHQLGVGELAAMTWAIETLTCRDAVSRHGTRVLRVDFDDFLTDPHSAMEAICAHFNIEIEGDFLRRLRENPAFGRYSKAPEHAYSPALRAEIIAASRAENAAEIRGGLAWLEALARREPALADIVSA